MAGASSASLLAACFNAGVSKEDIWSAILELGETLRQMGSYGNLSPELRKILEKYLPEDAHLKCNGCTYLGVTRILPAYQPMLIS